MLRTTASSNDSPSLYDASKSKFKEAVDKLDNRLTAVESKIGGIHNRIDDEALKRANLENRVRSVVPNLPLPPERV